jgi:hypothetical protein
VGRLAREREERKAGGLGGVCRLRDKRKRDGSAGPKEKRGGGEGFSLLKKIFSNSFSNFQTSLKQEIMHSNHNAQTIIIF